MHQISVSLQTIRAIQLLDFKLLLDTVGKLITVDAQSAMSILRQSMVFSSVTCNSLMALMHVMRLAYKLTHVPKLHSEFTPHALLLFCF